MLHPRSVSVVKFEGKVVEDHVLTGVNVFFVVYLSIFALAMLLISIDGLDFTTGFTAVAACLNNTGPGLELVGPIGNYSVFSGFSKVILSVAMLLGRLEIFPLLVLFSPSVWKQR